MTIYPNLIPDHIHRIHGDVQIDTSLNSYESTLKIPFDERILHGSLDYTEGDNYFYISSLNINKDIDQCRPILLFNRFPMTISVYEIIIDKLDLLSQYIKVKI